MSPGQSVRTLLGCAEPIVLAGMGGPSRAALVAAVGDAGGFGLLGMVREPPALIEREVETLRRLGHERFGVNIIPAATDAALLAAQLDTIIALRVPVVALFWDIDTAVVARLRDAGIRVIYQVGSPEEAVAAQQAGAELLVAQGREAGGHVRGRTPLRELLPAVVAAASVPVLAAGGLGSGADLMIAQALGAEGVMLGTRFLASAESFAHAYHKQRLIAAEASDTLLTEMFHINWPPGAPVRVLSSAVTAGGRGKPRAARQVIGDEEGRPIYLFSTDSPLQSMRGEFECMALYAGTGVGNIRAIRPAGDILREIVAEAGVAPTEDEEEARASSAPCYLSEVGGAYAGQLEPAEIRVELARLIGALRALLGATLASAAPPGEAPAFAAAGRPLARWIVRLLPGADAPEPNPGATRTAVVSHLRQFVPQLPDTPLRTDLAALREWLEQEV